MNKSNLFMATILGGLVALLTPGSPADAALVTFQFNGTQTGNPSTTVQALLGIDSSLVVPNGTFTQSSLGFSLSVQYNGAFAASGSALPASVSGQFNSSANVFSSLFVNDSLTTFTPSFTGTNNFQFFGANGQSWSMATAGFPPIGTQQITGTGTWTVAAVPVPAAVWLFGSGLAALVGVGRRKIHRAAEDQTALVL